MPDLQFFFDLNSPLTSRYISNVTNEITSYIVSTPICDNVKLKNIIGTLSVNYLNVFENNKLPVDKLYGVGEDTIKLPEGTITFNTYYKLRKNKDGQIEHYPGSHIFEIVSGTEHFLAVKGLVEIIFFADSSANVNVYFSK